ncbi:hypothetical protein RMHFA_04287 [Roseomonas mucosa]|nr:hypothetical protein RMHFA_04287 [Roseomonas mucosa]
MPPPARLPRSGAGCHAAMSWRHGSGIGARPAFPAARRSRQAAAAAEFMGGTLGGAGLDA